MLVGIAMTNLCLESAVDAKLIVSVSLGKLCSFQMEASVLSGLMKGTCAGLAMVTFLSWWPMSG